MVSQELEREPQSVVTRRNLVVGSTASLVLAAIGWYGFRERVREYRQPLREGLREEVRPYHRDQLTILGKSRLLLPGGEQEFSQGIYGVAIDQGALLRFPEPQTIGIEIPRRLVIEISFDPSQQPLLFTKTNLYNSGIWPKSSWRLPFNCGDLREGHVFAVLWRDWNLGAVWWDKRILAIRKT